MRFDLAILAKTTSIKNIKIMKLQERLLITGGCTGSNIGIPTKAILMIDDRMDRINPS
jgi:hypothetical protein